MSNQLTAMQILIETILYYQTHRRGLHGYGETCSYYAPEDGAMCAVGRCLNWTKCAPIKAADPEDLASISAKGLAYRAMDGLSPATPEVQHAYAVGYNPTALNPFLKKRYHGHATGTFWQHLQRLHDMGDYWEVSDDRTSNRLKCGAWSPVDDILKHCDGGVDDLMPAIMDCFADAEHRVSFELKLRQLGH